MHLKLICKCPGEASSGEVQFVVRDIDTTEFKNSLKTKNIESKQIRIYAQDQILTYIDKLAAILRQMEV
jgi:hypothetical protein